MASRQNKEAREEIPTYGTPMGPPPTPTPEREQERQEKLATKPTAAERRRRIKQHEEKAREESEKLEQEAESRKTEAPGPVPYESVRPGGGTPAEILEEREEDVQTALERAQGIEREPEPGRQPTTTVAPSIPPIKRDRPKQ